MNHNDEVREIDSEMRMEKGKLASFTHPYRHFSRPLVKGEGVSNERMNHPHPFLSISIAEM